ncbi:MAG TPA: delta-60 repeat domain-containing protein, partial [Flavobacteriales bacterium]|nr:delta-60 repeat domain-containing protein [Flavobacteriales bacterium]
MTCISRARLLSLGLVLWCAYPTARAQDGTLDLSFTVGTGFNSNVYAMALQADGKVLVGGLFTSYNGTTSNHLARLNADGSYDGTFNMGSGPNGYVSAIAVQPDGKILLSGQFFIYNGTAVPGLIRVNESG